MKQTTEVAVRLPTARCNIGRLRAALILETACVGLPVLFAIATQSRSAAVLGFTLLHIPGMFLGLVFMVPLALALSLFKAGGSVHALLSLGSIAAGQACFFYWICKRALPRSTLSIARFEESLRETVGEILESSLLRFGIVGADRGRDSMTILDRVLARYTQPGATLWVGRLDGLVVSLVGLEREGVGQMRLGMLLFRPGCDFDCCRAEMVAAARQEALRAGSSALLVRSATTPRLCERVELGRFAPSEFGLVERTGPSEAADEQALDTSANKR